MKVMAIYLVVIILIVLAIASVSSDTLAIQSAEQIGIGDSVALTLNP